MSTQKKIAANRENSKKSTGPRSKHGKKRSGANALTLGVYSTKWLLPGEDPKEYMALSNELHEELTPVGQMEKELVHDIIRDTWRLKRIDRAEHSLLNKLVAANEDAEFCKMSPIQEAASLSLLTLEGVPEALNVIHDQSSDVSPVEAKIMLEAVTAIGEVMSDSERGPNETIDAPFEFVRYAELQRFKRVTDVGARLVDAIVLTDGKQGMERLDRTRRLIRKDRLNCYSALKVLQDRRVRVAPSS